MTNVLATATVIVLIKRGKSFNKLSISVSYNITAVVSLHNSFQKLDHLTVT
jgi:hypothetical protein